jgi:hypothetical protein
LNNLFVHFGCTVAIWVEMYQNRIKFPNSHAILIPIITVVYITDNFLWTILSGVPVYPVITYTNCASYVYIGIALVMVCIGFFVGRWQYMKKTKLEESLLQKEDSQNRQIV